MCVQGYTMAAWRRTQGSVEHLTTGCQSVSQAHPLSQRRKYCNCPRRVSSATHTTRTLFDSIPKRFTNLVALTRNNNNFILTVYLILDTTTRQLLFDSRLKKKYIYIYREEILNSKLITIPRCWEKRGKKKERERRIRDDSRSRRW